MRIIHSPLRDCQAAFSVAKRRKWQLSEQKGNVVCYIGSTLAGVEESPRLKEKGTPGFVLTGWEGWRQATNEAKRLKFLRYFCGKGPGHSRRRTGRRSRLQRQKLHK